MINERPEGFHNIIGEAEGVISFMVEDAEGGLQSRGDEGASGRGTDNGVAIVEESIEAGFALGIALVAFAVTFGEERGPVDASGLRFMVFGVTGFDRLSEGKEFFSVGVFEQAGLSGNFCTDDGFPSLFASGEIDFELRHHTGNQFGMAQSGEEKTGGKVLFVADNDDGAGIEEGMENG